MNIKSLTYVLGQTWRFDLLNYLKRELPIEGMMLISPMLELQKNGKIVKINRASRI